jgi:mannose/fructose-specific phosphotransferase system component IIA
MSPLILLVGHGKLPSGVADAAELVLGPQPRLKVCELAPQDGPEDYGSRLAALLGDAGEALVLADLPGGTPANVTRSVAAVRRCRTRLVTGLNLPMLLEVMLSTAGDVDELAHVASSAGRAGVLDEKELAQ